MNRIQRGRTGVTVVIPARNAAPYLGEALRSVLSQTLEPAEIIVVDDHSTDATFEVASSFGPAVRVLSNTGPAGVSAALNLGIGESRSDHIAHFDADDIMRPRRLERQVMPYDSPLGHGLGFVGSDLVMFDERGYDGKTFLDGRPHFRRRYAPDCAGGVIWLGPEEACRALCREHYIDIKGIYPRCVWEEVGGFDTSMRCVSDMAFLWNVARRHPIAIIDEVLLEGRRHATNISKDGRVVAEECLRLFRTMLRETTNDDDRRVLRRRIAREYYDLADAFRRSSRYGKFALNYMRSLAFQA